MRVVVIEGVRGCGREWGKRGRGQEGNSERVKYSERGQKLNGREKNGSREGKEGGNERSTVPGMGGGEIERRKFTGSEKRGHRENGRKR